MAGRTPRSVKNSVHKDSYGCVVSRTFGECFFADWSELTLTTSQIVTPPFYSRHKLSNSNGT